MKKRDDGYYVAMRVMETHSGKKKKIYFYGKSPKEVEKKMLNYKGVVQKGMPFDEVAKKWYSSHEKKVEYYTFKGYKASYKDVLAEFETFRITEIQANDIQKFINYVANRGLAHQTVKMRLIVLSLICKYAIVEGYLSENPAAYVSVPRGLKKTRRDDVPQSTIDKIKASGELYPYFLLMTGLRPSEALAMRYEDIDHDNKRMRIYKKVVYKGQQPHIVEKTKTQSSVREIILLDKLADRIPQKKKGFLFEQNGKPYKPKYLFKYWKSLDLGITQYQLRHAYITMLYEAGIPAEIAMTQTGHSSITIMRDIYTHIRDNQLNDAAVKLNNFIDQ